MSPKYKYVSSKEIGLTPQSQISCCIVCPDPSSLHPDSRDLVIYGNRYWPHYEMCDLEEFESNGGPHKARTLLGPDVKFSEIEKKFEDKNKKLLKLRAEYKELVDLVKARDDKVHESNDIEQKSKQLDVQINNLEQQIDALVKQKQQCESELSKFIKDGDAKFSQQRGFIAVKRENLLKSVRKHVKDSAKAEDLKDIFSNLKRGELLFYSYDTN